MLRQKEKLIVSYTILGAQMHNACMKRAFCSNVIEFSLLLSNNYNMAENEQTDYTGTLQQLLIERKDWLEREELGKLKEELRTYQTSFTSLYHIFLKKKLINEDPYKQEAKISELEIPDSSLINEAKRIEQLSIRLSNFDNQLDFLVNFYQLGTDFLNLDRIKRIAGLIRYVDWPNLTPDAQEPMTKALAVLANSSKVGVDTITLSIIGESLTRLSRTTISSMTMLKGLSHYYKESFKLEVRQKITQGMSESDANLENIRKKFPAVMPGAPFYRELIEEIIKEDYSPNSNDLRDSVLNMLKVKAPKTKTAKPKIDFKIILLDGIQVIGSTGAILTEIGSKLDENQIIMENHKKGFFEAIKELIRQITKAEPEPIIYTVEYLDQTKGIPVKEKVNFSDLRDTMEKKTRILNSFVRGPAYQKLSAMPEDQIITYLEKNIKEAQNFHKILGAVDEYFKANVVPENRDKIKGIKPELSALKNAFVKANNLRHDYSSQKEADEQLKRLGVNLADPLPSVE